MSNLHNPIYDNSFNFEFPGVIEENQHGEDQGFKDDDINAMVNGIIDDSAPSTHEPEWASPLPDTSSNDIPLSKMAEDSKKILDANSSSEELDKKDDLAFNYKSPEASMDFLNE